MPSPSTPTASVGRRRAAALLLALAGVTAVAAQPRSPAGESRAALGEPQGFALGGEALAARTEEVASLMRCPVCQGLSVAASPTDSALAMKEEVRALLAAGYTEEQILAYFERSYGEFIRLVPKTEGFNLFVWIVPLAALLLGLAVVAARLRRSAPAAAEVPPELADYLERVRREVAS